MSASGLVQVARPGAIGRFSQPAREAVVGTIVAAGAAGVLYMWWHDTSAAAVQGAGPFLTSAGRVTGLLGTYLVVVEVLLMARAPWLDRMIGMDRLAVWHRRNGEYAVSLLIAHALLTIWGYSLTAHQGLAGETAEVVLHYPDMLAATVGLGLLVVIAVFSARAVRRRVSYNTWYFVHLYAYVALALSFAHQFNTGADFATHPLNRVIWASLYGSVAAVLLYYRAIRPIATMARHQFVVVGTVAEAPGVVSVYVTGRSLHDLRVEPGQFFMWRFLTRDGWWQAHPFSISAAPNGQWLRVTVKAVGDYSSALEHLHPGTRAVLEGPYGAFTARRRRRRKVLMIGAGIGVAPLRSLLEALPARPGDLTLVYRATDESSLALRGELEEIARQRGAMVHYLLGSREHHPEYLSPKHILELAGDVTRRDVFICGPRSFTRMVRESLRSLGVPSHQVHAESFEF
ncbi:MAG TPA: ferredoxin reductase family protein [Acidimicrobiales bacterium]|nr:ferredoxin reductase family protein [Acidimicrobiales bacterium]